MNKNRLGMIAGAGLVVICAVLGVVKALDGGHATGRLGTTDKVLRTPKNRHLPHAKKERIEKPGRAASALPAPRTHPEDAGVARPVEFPKARMEIDLYEGYAPEDRERAETLQDALDDDDTERILAAAEAAAHSENAELRSSAVEALGWVGKDGMTGLLDFMLDPDESVAADARNAWARALGEVEDDEERALLIGPIARVLKDGETVADMLNTINDMPDIHALQIILDIIDQGTDEAMQAALEHYEFMTSEPFESVERTQEWLNENWDDDDEAAVQADETRRVERFEADVEAAAEAAGRDAESVHAFLVDEAEKEGVSGEVFLQMIDDAAREAGKTRREFLAERLAELSAEDSEDTTARRVGEGADADGE